MNICKKHMQKLRKETKAYLNEYLAAQAAMDQAKADYEKSAEDTRVFISRHGNSPLEIARHKNTTEKVYILWQESKDAFEKVKNRRLSILDRAQEIREELKGEVEAVFLADPAKVDSNTMMLIDSGILKAKDYKKLFDDAYQGGNGTMIRLLSSAAKKAVDTVQDKADERMILNQIIHEASEAEKTDLQAYDEFVSGLKVGIGGADYHRDITPATVQYILDATADCED